MYIIFGQDLARQNESSEKIFHVLLKVMLTECELAELLIKSALLIFCSLNSTIILEKALTPLSVLYTIKPTI